jgi:hypothetical protein
MKNGHAAEKKTFFFTEPGRRSMDAVPVLLMAALVLIACAALLSVHHWSKHGADLKGTDRWFKCSDVGNFHSCSHEMWILLFVTAALALIVVATIISSAPQ